MKRPTPRQLRKVLDAVGVPEFTPSTQVETLRDKMDIGTFAAIGWVPPSNLSDDTWLRTGKTILSFERAMPWLWGDWYNARTSLQAERLLRHDWSGPGLHTLQNYASVARSYPHSLRREFLSYTHHAALVALESTERQEMLDWCSTPQRPSVVELREELRRRAAPKPPQTEPPPMPLRVDPPSEPDPKIELPMSDDVSIPITLYVPADLHARSTKSAAAEGMTLYKWIIWLMVAEESFPEHPLAGGRHGSLPTQSPDDFDGHEDDEQAA